MVQGRKTPPGYLSKREAAQRLGMNEKTLDRRAKIEPMLGRVLRKGRQVFWPVEDIEAYFRAGQERGYI